MARGMALKLVALPEPGAQQYQIALANLFGGALTMVMRKSVGSARADSPGQLLFSNGERNGVVIGFPPRLTKLLDLAHDLTPDIQSAGAAEIAACFPDEEWKSSGNPDLIYLVLVRQAGSILLRKMQITHGRFLVLVRVYGDPIDTPFIIRLLANQKEIGRVNVYQANSFLLRGDVPASSEINLSLQVCNLDNEPLTKIPPVTIPAMRVVWLPDS